MHGLVATRRVLAAASILALASIGAACTPTSPTADAGDEPGEPGDGGKAPPADASADVPSGDAAVGDTCAFNRECGKTARCECDESTGCACRTGARGTGKNGVDVCTTGNDCASSVCAEGQGGSFYCSDACTTAASCGPALPICADIALVGRICVRAADGG